MLSGIGPADHLAAHGLPVVLDAPGVGQNLIDHPEVPVIAIANGPYGYYRQGVGWRMLMNGLQFKTFDSGRILSVGFEAGAFVNPVDPRRAALDPGLLRADRLPRPRSPEGLRRHLRRHHHHRPRQAEVPRLREAALRPTPTPCRSSRRTSSSTPTTWRR